MTIHPGLPSISSRSFDCPHCGVRAQQLWYRALLHPLPQDKSTPSSCNRPQWLEVMARGSRVLVAPHKIRPPDHGEFDSLMPFWISQCHACSFPSLWLDDRTIWPPTSRAPQPNCDLPPHVTRVYDEARSILELSPAGSAALLRKALDLLCVHLGATKYRLDSKIREILDQPHFSVTVRKAANTIELFANRQLHPDEPSFSDAEFFAIQQDDDAHKAHELFGLLNLIAEHALTTPKKIDELHSGEVARNDERKAVGKATSKVAESASEGTSS